MGCYFMDCESQIYDAKFTLQLHKNVPPRWLGVLENTFTAAPLRVFLPNFQAYYKGHLR